tara:strand:- start:78 stop:368 length:291 start_codon:yes stop_codon:yes gene_type:complete
VNNRYKNTKFGSKQSNDSRKNLHVYQTTIYFRVPERDDDIYLIATEGDRCDILAHQYYRDSSLWWFIARVNNLKTMNIPKGTSLRLPSDLSSLGGA